MNDQQRQAEIDEMAKIVVCFPHEARFAQRFPDLVAEAKADPSVAPADFALIALRAMQSISPENEVADEIARDYRERVKVTTCKCVKEMHQ